MDDAIAQHDILECSKCSSLSSSSRRRAAPLSQAVFDGFYSLFLFSV